MNYIDEVADYIETLLFPHERTICGIAICGIAICGWDSTKGVVYRDADMPNDGRANFILYQTSPGSTSVLADDSYDLPQMTLAIRGQSIEEVSGIADEAETMLRNVRRQGHIVSIRTGRKSYTRFGARKLHQYSIPLDIVMERTK